MYTFNSEQLLFPEVEVSRGGYLPSYESSSGKVNIHHYSPTLRGIIVLYLPNQLDKKCSCSETRRHFESRPKTVNSQGYSELWEPIKMCQNCYPLIW